MKKLFFGLLFLPLLFPAPGFAAGEQAGVAAAVRGEVQVVTIADQVGHNIKSGEPIFLGDQINSKADSGLQVLLMDQTAFTIGPNSALVIDEFIYDPNTQTGKVTAQILKGTFRFVTGKVANKDPERMVVNLPSAVIGIRGTMVGGNVQGKRASVVLLGPGTNNNANERIGRVTVGNGAGQVLITRTGWGTFIDGSDAPTPPEIFTPQALDAITGSLQASSRKKKKEDGNGGSPAGKGDGKNASKLSGQDTAQAIKTSTQTGTLLTFADRAGDDQKDTIQDTISSNSDGETTAGEFRLITTGQFYFSQTSSVHFSGGTPGTFTFKFNVDFGAQTVGGGNSGISTTGIVASTSITSQSISSYADAEHIVENNFNQGDGTISNSAFNGSDAILFNHDGTIAGELEGTVVYAGAENLNYTFTTSDRFSGLAP